MRNVLFLFHLILKLLYGAGVLFSHLEINEAVEEKIMVDLGPKVGLSDSKPNTLKHHTMLSTVYWGTIDDI